MSDERPRDDAGRFRELSMNDRIRVQLGLPIAVERESEASPEPTDAKPVEPAGGFDGGQGGIPGTGRVTPPEDMNGLIRDAAAAKFFGRGFGG